MQDRITTTVRRRARWALVPAIAIALFAGLPAAMAADQQATDDAMTTEQSWRAARSGSYAQSYDQGTVYVPGRRSYR